ncbi:MAG: 2-oxoglutarate dehydrogenase complex dihydrolipoyllysine-residue succinyltransferase [Bacteroidetes bacterium]|nr:2-oxoglutarate dehydrogenase complex dihydrolipoyllysine-residue succinyltransferase [Bacteroidota bacterium]
MKLDIKIPSPGESITQVQLANWLVEDGEFVEKDQEIVEIDSDKATLSISAEANGSIKILVQEGDIIDVGAVIATIDSTARPTEKGAAKKVIKEVKPQIKVKEEKEPKVIKSSNVSFAHISPLAQKLMNEYRIDEKDLAEFFKSQRVTKKDVDYFLKEKEKAEVTSTSDHKASSRNIKRLKISMLRLKLADRLVSAKNETAMLTTFNEVNMGSIKNIRAQYKDQFEKTHGTGLGFMSFFTKAITEAIQHFPQVNAQIDGDEIIHFKYVDIGVAVSAPKGLVVPILRNAEQMSLAEIESKIKELATKARDNKITLDEMTGGTFTITNGGVFGSMLSTPILNPPQSAILGMHNIIDRPMAIGGKVEIQPIMYIALSYDHRIIDGKDSVGFLVKVKELLEDPSKMLFNGNDPIKSLLGI